MFLDSLKRLLYVARTRLRSCPEDMQSQCSLFVLLGFLLFLDLFLISTMDNKRKFPYHSQVPAFSVQAKRPHLQHAGTDMETGPRVFEQPQLNNYGEALVCEMM
jgi:hypothetical protein